MREICINGTYDHFSAGMVSLVGYMRQFVVHHHKIRTCEPNDSDTRKYVDYAEILQLVRHIAVTKACILGEVH